MGKDILGEEIFKNQIREIINGFRGSLNEITIVNSVDEIINQFAEEHGLLTVKKDYQENSKNVEFDDVCTIAINQVRTLERELEQKKLILEKIKTFLIDGFGKEGKFIKGIVRESSTNMKYIMEDMTNFFSQTNMTNMHANILFHSLIKENLSIEKETEYKTMPDYSGDPIATMKALKDSSWIDEFHIFIKEKDDRSKIFLDLVSSDGEELLLFILGWMLLEISS